MQVPVPSRTLLRSLMAASVVLLGAAGCSRPDRAETGSDNTAATMQDTAVTGATQDVPGTGQDRMAETTNPASENTGTGAAAGDTAPASVKSNAPRAATAPASPERRGNTRTPPASGAADTAAKPESDSARVTEDTSETSLNQGDTSSVAGYSEMARDTTGFVDQIDTTANAAMGADVQDTTMNAGRVRPIEDSTETMGQVTTDTGNVAATADTVAGDAAIAARGADTTGNAGRIRPPEDSTEMQGNTSSAESASVNAADTADEAPVASEGSESYTGDQETQVASEDGAEAVGAAAVAGTVTGADAVAMMTRGGERCNVVDPESDEEVRWDMSSTPSTLNPCGLGSMNLSKVWMAQR